MGRIPFYHRMTSRDLILRAERYAKRAGLSLSTVSGKILRDGSRLAQLKAGSRIWPDTLKRAERALAKLEAELERAQ